MMLPPGQENFLKSPALVFSVSANVAEIFSVRDLLSLDRLAMDLLKLILPICLKIKFLMIVLLRSPLLIN